MDRRRACNLLVLAAFLLTLLPALAVAASQPDLRKVDPVLLERLARAGRAEFYVILAEQADLSGAAALPTKQEKGAYVYEQLTRTAGETQRPLLAYLQAQNARYQAMYIQNMVRVEAGPAAVVWLAARPDVARIVSPPDPHPEPVYKRMVPDPQEPAIEWNIARIHAPEVWAMGFRGEEMVVASNDTGVDYTHPALVGQYRGNLGDGTFDHNYNWWGGAGDPSPHDDASGHGTHTTGTMVGDDGAGNQIGVAPGARWIACAGLDSSRMLECLEFFLAPWDLNRANPRPGLAPDAINNSWFDSSGFDYRPIIQNLNAAGIAVIKSAGNNGAGCQTISNPGYVPEIIATAAFSPGDTIADFSSRGPSDTYGSPLLKPEVAAPGVNIRSAVPGGDYEGGWSGTSMAAPHTTALVALIWNVAPCLRGNVPATRQIILEAAEPRIDPQCPPFVDHPNDVWGWGILHARFAVQTARGYCGGMGLLAGHVVDVATIAPIAGATVTAARPDGWQRNGGTDATGYYTVSLLPGTYTVTASAYGFFSQTIAGVGVITEVTTTQDLPLAVLPHYVVSGTVVEAGTGVPLAAQVEVPDAPILPVPTDPASGFYSLTLPAGAHSLRVIAARHGVVDRAVVVDHGQQQDFRLRRLPCILLVDDDADDPDVRAYYTTALDSLGYGYDVWDLARRGDPAAADLQGYRMVVWYTGYLWVNTMTHDNEAAVAAYLDAGGNLFLSSEDYLYDAGLDYFNRTYLGIVTYTNDVSAIDPLGNAASPIGSGLGPYTLTRPSGWPGTPFFTDRVEGSASPFRWQGSGQDNSTSRDGESYRAVFLGWPLEGLAGLDERVAVLGAIARWFGDCPCDPLQDTAFAWVPFTPGIGREVTFSGEAVGSRPIIFTWDLGDGGKGAGVRVVHTYATTGTFTVTLATKNACGQDQAVHAVSVQERPAGVVYLPLVFNR